MRTHLIEGKTPLSIDAEIVTYVKYQGTNPFPQGSKGIAILNEDGELYRMLICDSASEASGAASRLIALGMIDRLRFDNGRLTEIDVLTGKAVDTSWSGVFQFGDKPHPIPSVPRMRK